MSTSAVEALSETSSNAQGTSGRPAGGSSQRGRRGKPRRQPHDRQKPQNGERDEQNRSSRPLRKPPGLPDPVENPAEPEVTQADIDSEDELCFICGNSMTGRYYSLAPCNNAFCHVCSLRLRALYKSTNCPFCKTEHETVIFANSMEKPFSEYDEETFTYKDEKLGILFESEQIMEDSLLLLRFNCPDPSCDVACRNWSALKAHIKATHHRYLCSLCTQHKKVFTHEHILYTSRELSTHFATGDPVKDISMTGFTGHPKCKFCNQSFYSWDEFHQHSREKHERCHVCDRINSHRGVPDAQPRYFVNYDELWKHFSAEHYPCGAPECLEQKFVVFESEIDLKAHIMEVHMGRASKAELRDMRRVDVNFQYDTPSGHGRRKREEERQPARDVDISTLPRDERAYYRIQQAQRDQASRQIGNISIPPVRPRQEQFPALGSQSTSQPQPGPVRPVVEQFPPLSGQTSQSGSRSPTVPQQRPHLPPEAAARHAAVLEKAGRLLNNDPEKMAQFKSNVSLFRRSELSASDLIDRLWDIFNAKLDEFGKLITSTADLFDHDAKEKRTELLGAWNDWKIQMQEANSAASSGFLPQSTQRSRILRLKSSSTQGRPSASTQSVWNRIEAVAASRPVAAPTHSLPQRMSAMSLATGGRPAVPWTGTSSASAAATRPSAPVQQTQSRVPARNTLEEFPSLPTVKPREKIVLNAAANPPRPVVQWGAQPESSNSHNDAQEPVTKGKGKKKGKTVLFHVG